MGIFQDGAEEFKTLPTGGKVAVAVVLGGVVVFALVALKNRSTNTSGNSTTTTSGFPGGNASPDYFWSSTGMPSTPPDNPVPSHLPPPVPPKKPPVRTPGPGGHPKPVPVPAPPPKHLPPPKPPTKTPKPKLNIHTVQPDESLSEIAARYHIQGGWQAIYNKNKNVVDKTAQSHGHYHNDQNFIFAGEKLDLTGLH